MLYVPYAKVLILVALAAWLVTSVITAGSMHEGVTLNAAPSPVLIKRYLRFNVDMTTNGQTGNSKERASLLGLTTRLETILSKIVRNFQLWWWWLNPRTMCLKLHLKDDKLVESPGFFK